MPPSSVLTINCGSATMRFAAIEIQTGKCWLEGEADKLGQEKSIFEWRVDGAEAQVLTLSPDICLRQALLLIELAARQSQNASSLVAVAHRVVHGGSLYREPVPIDDVVLSLIESLAPVAPQHNPLAAKIIRIARCLFPDLQHIACFDTGFHKDLPPEAYLYGTPYELYEKHGVRRYGFHGFSHQHAAEETARLLGKPVSEISLISIHLGNGCSVNATDRGKSRDNSMGMTPMEGVVMASRSGDVDPGLIHYLRTQLHMELDEIDEMLEKKSGLLGLSGVSNDIRELRSEENSQLDRVKLAIEVFTYRLAKEIASARTALGHLDAITFTGGIGANDPDVRKRVIKRLGFLGATLDEAANADGGRRRNHLISLPRRKVSVFALPVNEESAMVKSCASLIRSKRPHPIETRCAATPAITLSL